jgi:hypothetical protein
MAKGKESNASKEEGRTDKTFVSDDVTIRNFLIILMESPYLSSYVQYLAGDPEILIFSWFNLVQLGSWL